MSTTKNTSLHGPLFALVGFAVFSAHDAVIKSLGNQFGVIQIMFFSTLFAMPWVSAMVLTDARAQNFRPNKPFMLLLRTFFALCSAGCAFFAFMRLPLADVYGLLFTTPIWITIMSIPFLGEKVGSFRGFAVCLGFLGVLVMLPLSLDDFDIGHLSAALAALCGAANSIVTRKIGNKEREAVMIMLPMLLSLIILAILMPIDYQAINQVELYKLITIGSMGFIGQLCIVMAYKRSQAALIAPMQYSQLIWAIIFGIAFFDQNLETRKLVGASIIIASGLIIIYREIRGTTTLNHPVSTIRNYRPDTIRMLIKNREKEHNVDQ